MESEPPLGVDAMREARSVLKAKPDLWNAQLGGSEVIPGTTPKQSALLRRFFFDQAHLCDNLLNASSAALKLVYRTNSNREGESLSDDLPEVAAVVNVLDLCLRHGLKVRRNLWGARRPYFDMIVESKLDKTSAVSSVQHMSDLKQGEKGFAWLKMALMEKQLADNMRILVENHDLIKQWYEPYAFLANDQSNVLLGLLLGLNNLDFSFYIKGSGSSSSDALDEDDTPLFLPFLNPDLPRKLGNQEDLLNLLSNKDNTGETTPLSPFSSAQSPSPSTTSQPEVFNPAAVVDVQSEFRPRSTSISSNLTVGSELDEVSRRLKTTLNQNTYLDQLQRDLQAKLNTKTAALSEVQRQADDAKKAAADLQDRLAKAESEIQRLKQAHQLQITAFREDMESEKRLSQTTKAELNTLYQQELRQRRAAEAALDQERLLRGQAESRTSLMEQQVKDAEIQFDSERCEHNREKAVLAQQLQEAQESLAEAQSSKAKISEDLSKARSARKSLIEEKKQLESAHQAVIAELQATKIKAQEFEAKASSLQSDLSSVGQRLQQQTDQNKDLEEKLQLQMQRETDLLAELAQARTTIRSLEEQIASLVEYKEKAIQQENLNQALKTVLDESNETILDLANELGKSKVRVDTLVHFKKRVKKEAWVDERLINNCQQCDVVFGLLNRKHHCRHCGRVFCDDCSSQRMALPSSAIPERVCDSCADFLISQHTVDL